MRLVSFRIIKYRSIEDSGEVSVDENITTFVGINESGKTNIMRALKKINQDDKKFVDLVENPNWHFGSFDPEETFVEATFKLNNNEIRRVDEITDGKLSLNTITFTKNKAMKLHCNLNVESLPFNKFQTNYLTQIKIVIDSIDVGSLENGQDYIDNLVNAYNAIGEEIDIEADVRQHPTHERVIQQMAEFQQILESVTHYPKMDEIVDMINKANSQMDNKQADVQKYLTSRLPRFIYFENTAIIDSRIHLPAFIKKIEANALNEDEKTAKTLLDLGNLDASEIYRLGKEDPKNRELVRQNKDRLDMTLSKASKRVSDEIDAVWSQNKHNIEFTAHGDDLRVWVTNKDDNVKLQLEERSRGYQWFFSFYTIFNAESDRGHKDAIILLDEPALFLHPKGQSDFLKSILPEIAAKNQIIYATHSPFMVDLAKPNSIHTVTLKDTSINKTTQKATCVSNEVWDNDKDALFPLQSALHYTMAQSLFIGTKNLIVEGITDFWILKGMSYALESASKDHLNNEITIVPAGGATRTPLLATMYKSQELGVVVLLDSDNEGERVHDKIVKNKVLRNRKVLLLNEVYNEPKHMAIEDLFPEEYYLKFVKDTYQDEMRKKGIDEISLDSKKPLIVKRLECYFQENNLGDFHKSRPARAIMTALGKSNIDELPKELIENFEVLFDEINKSVM